MKKVLCVFLVAILLGGCTIAKITTSYLAPSVETAASISEQTTGNAINSCTESTETSSPALSEPETAAGLTQEIKEYIYGFDSLVNIPGYDFQLYVTDFNDETNKFDLNGDGKNDEIKLKGKDLVSEEGNVKDYKTLVITINKEKLIIKSEEGYYFNYFEDKYDGGMPGEVTDINKNDNKKELIIIMYTNSGIAKEYIIKYDNGIPEIIGKVYDGFINPKFVNGSGFMVIFDKISETNAKVFKIIKLNDDRSGFIEIPLPLYKTQYTAYEGKTRSDVMLAVKPGEISNIELKNGTDVTVGYYDPKDYIEIRSGEETIGWLKLEGQGMAYLNKLFDDNIGSI